MILKQRGFNKPSTEIIRLSAFQNHLFSLIYIISEQGEIAQAKDHPGRYATGPRLSQAPFSGWRFAAVSNQVPVKFGEHACPAE